ncbi:ABC transporter ATP-binding protein [Dictyobacter arantiisoli]|uniref:Multidrug ABC transporter ATP-binding protein n=1 Tax=Dictyobacter arantiisoli TaxID=2014874 RepID=A0A5A5T7W7_9CHLR|nr:ABC transporter ATP-binding protein [Dictyobacter arantiisoli]GCF07550.1 multidrug ABC transporter ATP-binding protein [Dictyobacter arantiisoli]
MIKLLRLIRPYRIILVVVLVLAFAQAMANLYLPNLMADIVDNGIVKGDTDYIWRTGGLMLLVAIGGTICAIIGVYYSSRIAVGFGKIVREKIFTHVEQFSLHEFDSLSTASLITRTTNDTTQVQQVLVIALNMMITAPMMCIGGIIMAVRQDAALSWILVAIIPILVLAIVILMSNAIPLFRVMQLKLDRLNLIVDEGLTGVRVVRAFDRVKHEEQRFDDANQDLTNVATRVNRMMAFLMPIMMLVLNVSSVAILWFGSLRIDTLPVAQSVTEVGSLMAFLQYAMQILFSLLMVSMMFVMLPRAAASADRINAVLDVQPEIKEVAEGQVSQGVRGLVEFKHVTFSYPGAEEPALHDISFTSRAGEVTAIIGGTGSGKSTLVSLLPRFYDVDNGNVLIDGIDVREMSQSYLRSKIGFVPQKAVLFSGTISENLRYGKEDASEEEIRHAAEVAQANEFISGMPDGLDSVIAQGGNNVSGGQKQRLSIARALIRRPEIYVFDDSFSALDFKTDARLRAALKKETLDATMFIVAQRVSTVMDADRIIVLDEGHVAGIGTHRELMETCTVYREIVSSQLSAEEIA